MDEEKICGTCRYYNSNIPCGTTPSACKKADKFAKEFVDGLKKLKPTTKPCKDDLIRRSDAIKAMAKAIGHIVYDAEAVSQHVMNSIPAVEPKHGEWIFDDPLRADFKCSECLERNDICTEFCPHCGADMRKGATMKCCGNCKYRRQSKLKIQFNEIPITVYCSNENSPYYDKYVWDDEICDEWKGADDE